MNTLSSYQALKQPASKQWLIASILLLIMVLTRGGIVNHAHDASWAVLFLMGFYLRSYLGLPILLLSAIVIDFAVIAARGGHQDYYLTPSYLFIVPAYTTLWFGGRWLANHYSETVMGAVKFVGAAVVSIIICDLISSGGFYWSSAPVSELSMTEFLSRIVEFLPPYLKTMMLYLSVAVAIHLAFVQASKFDAKQSKESS